MRTKLMTMMMSGVLLAGVGGQANAQDDLDKVKSEMDKLRSEVAALRAQQQGDWMTDARRKEIKGLIDDVLADANKRGSVTGSKLLAGIDEKGKVFLKSDDGNFTMNFSGQIQFRYIWNSLDTDNASTTRASDSLSGFQMRRVKFGVKGEVGDGWGYYLKFSGQRALSDSSELGAGDVYFSDAYITKDLGDGWSLLAGVAKLPFARQELISSTRQVGVDRGLVTEFFTLNRSDMVQLSHSTGDFKYAIALSDGGNASFSAAQADASNDFAATGRVDWLAVGDDWGASKHAFGGVDNDALFVGAAVHYEQAEGSAAGLPESGLAWTVDALYKTGSWGLTAAIFGNHTDNSTASDSDQYGLMAQADYKLNKKWDVFARWEMIDDDGVSSTATSELEALTFGVNHHFSKNVKFTGDIVWIYAGDNPTADGNFPYGGELSSGLGLSSTAFTAADDHDDQIALRLQLQLLF